MEQWVRRLLGLTIVAGALEFLLPLGEIRRFSRMVLGMVLVLTITTPLLSIRGLGPPPVLPSINQRQPEERDRIVERVFNLRLSQELSSLLKDRGYTCKEAKAFWKDGELERVEVRIAKEELGAEKLGEKACVLVAKHLGLARGQVSVVEEGT